MTEEDKKQELRENLIAFIHYTHCDKSDIDSLMDSMEYWLENQEFDCENVEEDERWNDYSDRQIVCTMFDECSDETLTKILKGLKEQW